MDAYEATKIVFQRIQTLDPENASKIMGFLLIQDHGDKEIIRLAFGPENSLHSVIHKAKKELNLASPNTPSSPSLFSINSLPFSRQNSSSSSASSRLINIPSPLSITSNSWTDEFAYSDHFYANNGGEVDLIDELQLQDQLSFLNDGKEAVLYPSLPHRRSCSVSDICLYYAKGYCKNGSNCRFLHHVDGGLGAEEGGVTVGSPNFPWSPSPTNKCMDFFMMQNQMQDDSPRRRLQRGDFGMNFMNPVSRQIYLTFPCESTFKEEDVSNYFSIFGPVQDVRIPYQQKRMFGFVTFDYPETVKLILAKGNPHFVCDARVLVKPYKEKGKIPEKHSICRRHQQQMEMGEFPGCGSPTGLESRDPYDLQLGASMFYKNQDMLRRRELEEQIDLQQAIELQNRRLMSLKLLDVKRNHHHHHRAFSTGAVISSPTYSPTFFNQNSVLFDDRSKSPEAKQEIGSIGKVPNLVYTEDLVIMKDKVKDDYANGKQSPQREIIDLQESMVHNLPDSPFASSKPVDGEKDITIDSQTPSTSSNLISGSSLFLPSSCYFQVPRFSSGQETIGMM